MPKHRRTNIVHRIRNDRVFDLKQTIAISNKFSNPIDFILLVKYLHLYVPAFHPLS